MWTVVAFPDNEVAAVPCSWLIEIQGKTKCFWPEENAITKRAKDDNPPSSGNDKYVIDECRVLTNGEKFNTFKEALAMEILAQDVSCIEDLGCESDGGSSSKKQKLSDEDDEFEFVKAKKEIHIIDDVKINEASTTLATSTSENELKPLQSSSVDLNNHEEANKALISHEDNQSNILEKDYSDNQEVLESTSDSEKIKTILLNQEAEKKMYTELINRIDRVEKYINKNGGVSFSKVIEQLPLQVSSVEMFSELEEALVDATKTAVVKHFDKTIFEKDIKQVVKILLNRFFDNKFFAHHVTGTSGAKVVLNKTRTLGCIYDAVECYQRAVNMFKMAKNWGQAGNAFSQAANLHSKAGNRHDAATNYVNASNCYKRVDPNEAVSCLLKATEIYTDMGRFSMATKHHQSIDEMYENEANDLQRSVQDYEQAADYFRGEESISSANRCMLKVAQYVAQLEDYEKAIQICEQVASSCLDSSLLKHSAKEYFFRASLCHLSVDLLNARNALEKYSLQYPAFQDSREYKLVKDLCEHLEEQNIEGFTEAVKDYDSISRLDQWYTTISLRIKKQANDNPDVR